MIFFALLITTIALLVVMFIKNKKFFYILVTILVSIFIIYTITIFINHKTIKKYTIEEITGIGFNDIAYVECDYINNDLNAFKNKYKNALFKKELYLDEKIKNWINPPLLSGRKRIEYVCYDKNNNILYTLINQTNSYHIIIGEEKYNNNDLYYSVK